MTYRAHYLPSLLLLFMILAVPACIGGPCVHSIDDELLHIDRVTDAETNASIASIVITEIRRGGMVVSLGLSGGDEPVRCRTPCSLDLSQPGTYELDISADGYEAETFVVEASWAVSEGGCPSRVDEGTRIEIALTPQ